MVNSDYFFSCRTHHVSHHGANLPRLLIWAGLWKPNRGRQGPPGNDAHGGSSLVRPKPAWIASK